MSTISRNLHLLPQETVQRKLLSKLPWGPQLRSHERKKFKSFFPFGANQWGGWGAWFTLRTDNLEEAELNRYIQVLQARKNKNDIRKEATRPSEASTGQNGPAKWCTLCLKGHTMPPWLIPFPSTPVPAVPTPIPTVQFMATNQVKHKHINCLQLGSIQENLPFKELRAFAPEVRSHFKETMTTERLQALPAEAQAVAAHMVLLDGCESWASCGQPNTTTSDNWGYIGWHDNSHRHYR